MASKTHQAAEKPTVARPIEPFLSFSAPWCGAEEKEEILKVLESDWITTGPRTRAFEAAVSEYVGSQESVAVNSCTAALHLALAALGVGSGDAVITSPFTFAATANVVVHRGAAPVFIDIRPDTYNLDPSKLREFLEEHCRWDPATRELRVRASQKRVRLDMFPAGRLSWLIKRSEAAEA